MTRFLLENQVALFTLVFALSIIVLRLVPTLRRTAWAGTAAAICGVLSLGVYTALSLLNLRRPGFLWHDEPNVLSIAAAYTRGQPIYHPLHVDRLYALLYGPSTFLLFAAPLKVFGYSPLALHLLILAMAMACAVCLYMLMLPRVGRLAALALLALPLAFLMLAPSRLFAIRGDLAMLLCFAVGLLAAERLRWVPGALLSGAGCGVAMDFKLTVAPVVLLLLVMLYRRRGARAAALAAVTAVAVGLGIFALPGISLHDYWLWLTLSAHQGLDHKLLLENLFSAAFLLAPGIILRVARRAAKGDRWSRLEAALFFLALAGCVLTGAKDGAGYWHLWPILPFLVVWTCEPIAGLKRGAGVFTSADTGPVALAIALALTVVVLRQGYRDLRVLLPLSTADQWRRSHDMDLELAALAQRYRGRNLVMGYGVSTADPRTSERAVLQMQGEQYVLDENAVVEATKANEGVPPPLLQRMLGCQDLWLFPRGEAPFSSLRFGSLPVTDTPYLFPDTVRRPFAMSHKMIAEGQFYDVWGCAR